MKTPPCRPSAASLFMVARSALVSVAASLPAIAAVAVLVGGCAAPKVKTSFLTSVDLVDMTSQMAESFGASPALVDRTPYSPRWIISIDKIVNNTNQIISENEKWAYIGRLRALLTQTKIADQRNLAWIVPPERWPLVAKELNALGEPPDLRRPPTHVLTGAFDSLTNSSGQGRSDAYLCAFQLVELRSGAVVWEDSWEVKRVVTGTTYD
jgi:hypothetical protein